MIVTCEDCGTRFHLDPETLGSGKRVRCTNCDYEWFQEPESDEPVEAGDIPESVKPDPVELPPEEDTGEQEAVSEAGTEENALDFDDSAPATEEEPSSPEPDPPAEETTSPHINKARMAGYAAAASVFLLIGGGLVMMQETMTKAWPPSAAIYSLAGLTSGGHTEKHAEGVHKEGGHHEPAHKEQHDDHGHAGGHH